jgi:hypothetical protein
LNQGDEGEEGGDDDDPLQGGAGGHGPPGTVTITLSPQDQQAINRVCDHLNLKKNMTNSSSFSYKIWVSNAIVLLKHFLLVIAMKNWQLTIF